MFFSIKLHFHHIYSSVWDRNAANCSIHQNSYSTKLPFSLLNVS
uniref:Uncharacterized protein n=1 Tax=Anguilla anguilla TaxID=7936 RepID=A0A0E9VIG7_ANGAN